MIGVYGYSVRLIQLNQRADQKRLGVRLGKACIKRGLSVRDVSLTLRVSRQTVYNWFVGKTAPQKLVEPQVVKLLASLNK